MSNEEIEVLERVKARGILGATADQIVNGSATGFLPVSSVSDNLAGIQPAPNPTRAPRSDKGTKRVKPQPPAPAAVPGAITQKQAQRLNELVDTMICKSGMLGIAIEEDREAQKAYRDYLDALTGK